MTKHTRRILFYTFIGVFFLFSLIVVFIALGYSYDFTHNSIVKTGALGLTTNTSASVYINDRLQGQTSFLGDSFTKNRLIPGEYNLRVEKKDYLPWAKKITINAGVYTDFPSIVLLPKQVQTETFIENVSALAGSQMIYKDWLFYVNHNGYLGYINIHSNSNKPVKEFDGNDGIKMTASYKVIAFDPSGNLMVLSSGTTAYLLDLNNGTTKILPKMPFKTTSYIRNNVLYGLSNSQIIAYDLLTVTSKILLKKIRSFSLSGDSLVYIDSSLKNLHVYSIITSTESDPVPLPSGITQISQFINQNNGKYLILGTATQSGLFRLDATNLIKLSDYANKIVFSPNQSRLIYFTSNEISVIYLENTTRQPYKNSGDQELITRISKPIFNPSWYKDNEHLLIQSNDTISLLEVDGRGGRNMATIDNATQFDYDARSNAVYEIKDGDLIKISLD